MNRCDEPSRALPVETEFERLAAFRFFVRESNRIEGINRAPSKRELEAHAEFLERPSLMVGDVAAFVAKVARARLRNQPGMNVRVGNHLPPPGGPGVESGLAVILARANRAEDPWDVHVAYETLHPFMDGNGRSGRAIWLWQMIRQQRAGHALRMGFLYLWYYQTLQHAGPRQHDARDGASPKTPDPESQQETLKR